jgi:uncharacterized membrane protein (DUF485 family)
MITYDWIDAFRTFSQKATAMPSFAATTHCHHECPWDIESIFRQEIVAFVREPTKILIFFTELLGISITFCYVMVKTPLKPFFLEDLSCRLSVCTPEDQRVLQRMKQVLPEEQLTALSRQTGAVKRMRKIKPINLLGALCLLALHSSCSLRLAAMFTGILGGCVLSKQALAQRINESWVRLFRGILSCILARATLPVEKASGLFNSFKRVLVQDSTSLALPQKLASFFPGSGNQMKKHNAMIRLQTVLDLLSETFVHFHIAAFTYNDQRASSDILSIISPGDLIIRDLGYFVPLHFRSIIDKHAYFLSRYHHRTDLFYTNGNKIDLLTVLKKAHSLDLWILLGKQARVPVRLLCIPVPEQVANERRRKLHQNKKRDRRLNPSKEQRALCGWSIFITNVPESIWTIQDVSNVYGLRWRIETIFKAWKSHFNFNELTDGCKDYVLILIYTRLIFITLFQTTFMGLEKRIDSNTRASPLSILKFAQFFVLLVTMAFGRSIVDSDLLIMNILKHCTYEKRRNRLSYGDIRQSLLN